MNSRKTLNKIRLHRKKRARAKICGTSKHPRLSVFRSNHYTYCQLINDEKNIILTGASTKGIPQEAIHGAKKTKLAEKLGEIMAKKAIEKGIKKIVFDRGMYKYHGRVKAIAEGIKRGGLIL